MNPAAPSPTMLVQISAGVGPVEVRRFVGKLAEYLEEQFRAAGTLEICSVVHQGDRSAPHSAIFYICLGDPIADLLRLNQEVGTHLLLQKNIDRGTHSRKRWYADVSLHSASVSSAEAMKPADVLVTACRAGGPGGQHVNKVSTAIRATHRPSGISVRVASERSQKMNSSRAFKRIAELLALRTQTALAAAQESRRTRHYQVVRGNPIRSYVLSSDAEDAHLLPLDQTNSSRKGARK